MTGVEPATSTLARLRSSQLSYTRLSETSLEKSCLPINYGEGGIRTHGTALTVHAISSRAHSTTLAPLQTSTGPPEGPANGEGGIRTHGAL